MGPFLAKSLPCAGGQLAHELAIVAKEEAQPLGDGQYNLTMWDVFEQLLGPYGPQKLTLLVA
jgi:hypothetical protein